MKKNHLLIWACLIMSCSGNSEIFEPEIGYIDYANYPLEKLTQNDRTLLENVSFQEGKLTSLPQSKESPKKNTIISLNIYKTKTYEWKDI